MTTLADLRREYASRALTEADALDDPIQQFSLWFGEALKSELLDTNAMTLATASRDGTPSARIVLLKGFDDAGFVFFTNYESAKARDLEGNPQACLLLFWAALERQVRISGRVSKTPSKESETYFQSRPFESQIGAWASAQSRSLDGRAALEARYAELAAKYAGGPVPLPPFWGGYLLLPRVVEFWESRSDRLHDRVEYRRGADGSWHPRRLQP